MVGAQLIGEFAWSVENLLNRVINKTLDRTPDMMTLLREAVAAVPELVEQLETGRAPQADIARIINTANTLAGVRPIGAAAAPAPGAALAQFGDRSRRCSPPPWRRRHCRPAAKKNSASPGGITPAAAGASEWTRGCTRSTPKKPRDTSRPSMSSSRRAARVAALCRHRGPASLLSHAERHGENRRRAPGHQDRRAAESLHPQALRQLHRHVGRRARVLTDAVTAIQQVVEHIDENTGFFLDHAIVGA